MKTWGAHTSAHLLSDAPILTRAADRLGRARFADAIADAIAGSAGQASVVIAIYGAWGSGKSSVKNMVLEALEKAPTHKRPRVLQFSPWLLASQSQILAAFFEDLAKLLGRDVSDSRLRRLAAKLRAYSSALQFSRRVVEKVPALLLGVIASLGVLGIGFSFVGPHEMAVVLRAIGISAILLALALRFGEKLLTSLSELQKARADARKKTLQELKDELATLMEAQEVKTLVVIDDIDRLTPQGVDLVLQLVKANADLPKMMFLLAFQRSLVEEILVERHGAAGRGYLSKIVQVGFDLPALDRAQVESILSSALDSIMPTPAGEALDVLRWGNTLAAALEVYFPSIREVTRFVGGLDFYLGVFRAGATMEVNAIDLFVLEVLRVFEPTLYERLPQERVLLLGGEVGGLGSNRNEEERKRLEDRLLSGVPDQRRPVVRDLLGDLFPRVKWIFGDSTSEEKSPGKWERELRVCAPSLFERYFRFGLAQREVSKADIDALLSFVGDRESFLQRFRAFPEAALNELLTRLAAQAPSIPSEHSHSLVAALLEIGDGLPRPKRGPFTLNLDYRVGQLVYLHLMRYDVIEIRGEILHRAVADSKSRYMAGYLADWGRKSDDADKALVTPDRAATITGIVVSRIRQAASDGSLRDSATLREELILWQTEGAKEIVRSWVSDQLRDHPRFVMKLLEAFLEFSTSSGMRDRLPSVNYYIDLDGLEKVAELGEVEGCLHNVTAPTADEQISIAALNASLKKRGRGISQSSLEWGRSDS